MVRDLVAVVGQSSDKGGGRSVARVAAPTKTIAHHAHLHQGAKARAASASHDDAPDEAPTSTSHEKQLHDF
jgi:hypothetical protein